jgi:predicted nucleic acid-binding protein
LSRFVIDASVAAAWCFEDEHTDPTLVLLERLRAGERALVPALWSFEIANIVWAARRTGRVTADKARKCLDLLRVLPIEVEFEPPARVFDSVTNLAVRYDITVYDASYLELAIRDDLPLATLDRELARAAQEAGVTAL